MRPIVTILTGSYLYGTNIEGSDHDFKVVYVPSAKSILMGPKADEENTTRTRNEIGEWLAKLKGVNTVDVEFIELAKFVRLLCQGQTNAMDMLFAPQGNYIGKPSAEWYAFVGNRDRFLSRNCHAFVKYCKEQVDKYVVKSGRYDAVTDIVTWLSAIGIKGMRLHVAPQLEQMVESSSQYGFVDIELPSGDTIRHLDVCDTLVPLTATVKEALKIYEIQRKRYGRRVGKGAEGSARDWKSMYHAVRVSHEAVELLRTGKLTFPREEHELLLQIRRGNLIFEIVQDLIRAGLEETERAALVSTLPEEPDMAYAESLVENFYRTEVCVGQENE